MAEKEMSYDDVSPTGLFLVTCVDDEGMSPNRFRLVRASSRQAVAAAILSQPYDWENFLRWAGLWEVAVRGDAAYYEEPRPLSATAFLTRVDASYIDGDSRAQLTILPIPTIEDTNIT
jgi:hypothetical protein